jgi:hypothetical protein
MASDYNSGWGEVMTGCGQGGGGGSLEENRDMCTKGWPRGAQVAERLVQQDQENSQREKLAAAPGLSAQVRKC